MRRFCFTIVTLLAPAAADAQEVDEQLWLQANAVTKAGDATLTLETIGRFSDAAGGFAHAELGGLASVPVLKGVDLGFGYRHVADWDHGHKLPNEERLRQMVTIALGGGFSTRTRLEERFHSSGGEIGLRIRQQLRFTYPLTHGGLAAFATHESFINFNTTGWGQRRGYERMRHSVGLSIPMSRTLKGEAGYLNQYRFAQNGGRDHMDHVATFALTHSF